MLNSIKSLCDPYQLFKNLAFKIDPETIHENSMSLLKHAPQLAQLFAQQDLTDAYRVSLGSLNWRFPVGLAAGLDKNAMAINFFSRLYFGALEVGTVTPKPQRGNPKPRLFRYPKEASLRNCMGFNNQGAEDIFKNISLSKRNCVIGINLGKNKTTPNDKAGEDYRVLYKKFSPLADYLVLNISSPNTPGLRDLQEVRALQDVLDQLVEERKQYACPLYLKIAPDLEKKQVFELVDFANKNKFEGLIATNTTRVPELGEGGVSGQLLQSKAKQVRAWVLEATRGQEMQCIGVGGISSFQDLLEFWQQGGRVVQIYTAFIFQGPRILKQIKDSIDELMCREGIHNLNELISAVQTRHIEV